MYYLLNHIFIVFITIAISIAYTKEASSGFVLAFLLIAAVANLCASAYATSKYMHLKTASRSWRIRRRTNDAKVY